ncbi:MAG: cob(I)yrinic acid a,c-diamide adenosyltransferase [Lachnospiraceae bacterium]|nr:cob(I)yrinic acid a,c-diamide adenosyltransferase [Lachnospiraceae bacterium]
MAEGFIRVYCGRGKGKTTAAIGLGLSEAAKGNSVVIIQFLKDRKEDEIEFLSRLEPEVKFFRFERSAESFESLSESDKKEEVINIKNGMNFARKVLSTEGCSLLVLDELLGLVDQHVISPQDVIEILDAKDEDTSVVMTGITMCPELEAYVDEIYNIDIVKNR